MDPQLCNAIFVTISMDGHNRIVFVKYAQDRMLTNAVLTIKELNKLLLAMMVIY